MNKFILILTVFIFSGTVCAEQTPIYKEGRIIYYNAPIDSNGFNIVKKLYNLEVGLLIFNSPGGEAGIAMKFAKWIIEHDLEIEIDRYCLSSCANYIFPAGKIKYLNEWSVIGWHGGALQFKKTPIELNDIRTVLSFSNNCDFSKLPKNNILIFESKIKSECVFYKSLSINPIITMYGQTLNDIFYQKNVDFWSYSLDAMEFLGINEIVVKGTDWTPVKMIQEKNIKYFQLNEIKEVLKKAGKSSLLFPLVTGAEP